MARAHTIAGYSPGYLPGNAIDGINGAFFNDPNALCVMTCKDPMALGVTLAAMNNAKALVVATEATTLDAESAQHRVSGAWRERTRDLTRGHPGAARPKNQMAGVIAADPVPYTYYTKHPMQYNLAVDIVVCHFSTAELAHANRVLAAVRSMGRRDRLIVVTVSAMPYQRERLLAGFSAVLGREIQHVHVDEAHVLQPPMPNSPKIIRRTMPCMEPPSRDAIEAMASPCENLDRAYASQMAGMIEHGFDTVVCAWCKQLRQKHASIRLVCVTHHEPAQNKLERAFQAAGVKCVDVWTVRQVHDLFGAPSRGNVNSALTEAEAAAAAPNMLIFCEPQLNPWDQWLCMAALGARGSERMRVAVCFWTSLDTEIYALDDQKYEFVSEWTKGHAAVASKLIKKLKYSVR